MSRFNLYQRRYNRAVIVLWLLYTGCLFVAIYAFKHQLIGGLAAYVVAALPALPIIGIFFAIGRYLGEEQDEYLRMLMVRQTLWASAFALSLATVWGFLENFGLVGHIDAYYGAVVWFLGLGLGALINKLTLRSAANC
jgi:hypothetical protein